MENCISRDLVISIEHIQERFNQVYGSYDLNKSMIWMVEELGEVVSAIRKGKTKGEIQGELGDLLAWIFCLGNILDINISQALTLTFEKEVNRQFEVYGKLKYSEKIDSV